MDVSLDADGNIDRGSGFYGACGALSASGVGQKENNAIGCVIVAGIGVVVCSGLSEAGQLQVLRSPAGNYQVILEKDEETGQLMLNRPYKGFFRYQKELLPFTADSKVNSRWLQEDACALYGTDTDATRRRIFDLWQPQHGRYRLCGSPQHDARYLGRNGRRWTDMDLSVGGQDAVKDAWVRLPGKR